MDKEYETPSKFYNWCFVQCYRYLNFCARVRIHTTGMEKLPEDRRFVLVSNHRSNFDNFIHCAKLNKEIIAYISKPENFKIPMGRHFMKRNLYLAINRGHPEDGLKVINKATEYVKNDLVSVGIFPEGSRSKDGSVKQFKAGCFKVAERGNCPIVVTSIQGTEKIHKNWPLKRTDVYFDILEVIDPSIWQEKSTVQVADYTRELIVNNIKK